jgi:predicted dehydrogenase
MTDNPVRIGIIGAGRIARQRVGPAIHATDLAVLHGVASRDPRRAADLGPGHVYDSYEALLRDPDVEAVYIATHNGLHRPLVLEALSEGKHVLCEKPLGCSAADCAEMVAAAEEAGRILLEAFMYRYHPQLSEAQRQIADGAVGELTAMESSFRIFLERGDDVRWRAAWGGGSLFDVGCYCVNISRLFLGDEPRAVRAWATNDKEYDVDTSVHAVLEYHDGRHARLSCGFDGGMHQRAVLIRTEGVIEMPEPFVTWMRPPTMIVRRGDDEKIVDFDPVDTFRLEVEDLSRAVRTGVAPLLPPTDGLANARIIDRILEASRTVG